MSITGNREFRWVIKPSIASVEYALGTLQFFDRHQVDNATMKLNLLLFGSSVLAIALEKRDKVRGSR